MIFIWISFFLGLVLLSSFYFTPFCPNVRRIKTSEKIIALTFDDGPNPPFTNQIIKILDQYQVKATFFMTGKNVQKHPEVVRKVLASGHDVGNHSFSHPVLIFKSTIFIQHEIEWTDILLKNVGAKGEVPFRSPHGMQLFRLSNELKSTNRKNILFNVLAWDWKLQSPKLITFLAALLVRPGSIIALHDGGGDRSATVKALPLIISKLEQKGYKFKTLSDILEKK
jgi:peptidoglycan-N-acetylglucosamine deacetylase